MPICLWWVRKRLILVAPQGSVVLDACKGAQAIAQLLSLRNVGS